MPFEEPPAAPQAGFMGVFSGSDKNVTRQLGFNFFCC